MRSFAPKIGAPVLVSSLVEPQLILHVREVLKYDSDHDAWEIGTVVNCREAHLVPMVDATLWIQKRRDRWLASSDPQWAIYDIGTPLVVRDGAP